MKNMDNTIGRKMMVVVFGVCCRTTEAVWCWRLGGSLWLFLLVKVRCYAEYSKSYIEGNWKVLCFALEEVS
jgi:hypothetical protein